MENSIEENSSFSTEKYCLMVFGSLSTSVQWALEVSKLILSTYSNINIYFCSHFSPENVPRLFDLIRVEDERVLPAFYFALRDTLVAENLDQGQRIAYGAKRYRVVTLGGDVIETSGTMSGGGRSMQRGRMGTKVQTKTSASDTPKSNKELEHLQVRAQEIQSQINFLQEQQGELEQQIQRMGSQLKNQENEVKRLKMDVTSLAEQLPRLKDQVERQQARVAQTHSDPEKVRALEAQVAECKETHTKSSEAANTIQKQVDGVTKKINDITNSKVKDLQTKINNLTKQIDKLTTNISKLTVEVKTSERNVKKTEDKIKNMEEEVISAEQAIRSGCEEREALEKEASDLKQEIDELKVEIEKAHDGSSSIKKEIVAIQKKEAEGKMKRLEFEQILQSIEKKLSEVKDTIPHWKNKVSFFSLFSWALNGLTGFKIYSFFFLGRLMYNSKINDHDSGL